MRLTRRLRVVSVAAVAGMGVPLLVSVSAGTTPAAGQSRRDLTVHGRQPAIQDVEKRMEKPGYLQARARYYDARRLSGTHPITIEKAARLRANAAHDGKALRNAPASRAASADAAWQAVPGTTTLQPGRTSGNFQEVSGRISALAVDDSGDIYAGAAQGGVWRYDPSSGQWTALTDNLSTLAVGALAIAPSNQKVIYLGTGEGDLSGDSYFGNGIYRSTDGGDTWSHVNSGKNFTGASVSDIVVDPQNPNRLYASTIRGKAGVFRVTSPFEDHWGIYRSIDGGKHWTPLRTTTNIDHGATDLTLDPQNRHNVYATFLGQGIYETKPHTGQKKWHKRMTGLPRADYSGVRFALSATKLSHGRTRLYSGFDWTTKSGQHRPSRVFRSDDGGRNWKATGTDGPLQQIDTVRNYCDIQCTYDNVVTADPNHPNIVYVAGEYNYAIGSGGIYRSNDSGASWKNLGFDLHPDFHAVALQPNKTSHVVIGNDGGVWDSATRGGRTEADNANLEDASWEDLNDGLQITQVDSVDYSNHGWAGPDVLYAGTQDNGTQIGLHGSAVGIDSLNYLWLDIGGGDGGVTFVDQNNPDYVFGEFYGISPYRWSDGGWFFTQNYITHGINTHDRSEFYAPWTENGLHTNQLLYGTYRVYRTDNAEAAKAGDVTWKPISGDLTTGCTGPAPNTGRGCLVSAVGMSDGGSGAYAGTEEGLLWSAPDGLTSDNPTWTQTTSTVPARPVSSFAVDKSDWRTAYASFTGYNVTTPDTPGHVFATTDGGKTWTNISGEAGHQLPDNPVNDLQLDPSDPNTLWAGTDVGVFVTHNAGQDWAQLGSGLPVVAVYSLKWDPETARLIAGTHGRGNWEFEDGSTRPALAISTSDSGAPVGPGSTIDYTLTLRNLGNADATGVSISQPLPPHTSFVSADQGGTENSGTVTWSGLTVPAGDQVQVHYSAMITQYLASRVDSITSDHAQATADGGYATSGSPYVTPIAPAYAVKVSPSSQLDGARSGNTVTYPVDVTNKGYNTDSYTVTTDQHWNTTVYDSDCSTPLSDTGDVAPGDTKTVCIAVDVPADAQDGETDDQIVTVQSDTKSAVNDTATVTAVAITKDTLLVDEDGNAPDVQSAYTDALDANGIDYSVWDLSEHDTLPAGILNAYKSVYWFTGTSYPEPLSRFGDELSAYLDNGGSLFVSGMDLLDQAGGTTDFVKNYLHVNWDGQETQNDKPTDAFHGVGGTDIGGAFDSVPENLPAGYGHYEDEITPTGAAVTQFTDDSGQPDALAVTDNNGGSDYRVVFMAFPFEAFGTATDRATAIQKVSQYLSPTP